MLDIYKTMSKDEIIATVDKMVNKGRNGKLYPYHYVTYIGGRAPYRDYEATVVVTRSVRFIPHSKTKIYKFEEGVRNAETAEQVEALEKEYEAFDKEHQDRISANVLRILADKQDKIKAGLELGESSKKTISEETEKEREKLAFYMTACKNGNVTLQVHDSFRKVFKKGCYRVSEYEQPKYQFFLAKRGVVKEIEGSSETAKKILDEILDKVYATKSKSSEGKEHKPSQVRSISISNILEIK